MWKILKLSSDGASSGSKKRKGVYGTVWRILHLAGVLIEAVEFVCSLFNDALSVTQTIQRRMEW
jgi:hypothetical protein